MNDKLFDERYRIETLRLPERDYSEPGSYFITICTAWRICIFGNVEKWNVVLNDFGNIVKQEIYNMEDSRIDIDVWVIMPNHIHIILTIKEDYAWGTPIPDYIQWHTNTVETSIYGVSEARVEKWCKMDSILHAMNYNQNWHAMNYNQNWHAMNRVSTGKWWITWSKNVMFNKRSIWYIIRQLKWRTTFLIRKQNLSFGRQSNYYEHVIRDERDFNRIASYILHNPLKRRNDEYYK